MKTAGAQRPEAEGLPDRAARCTENIGASRFRRHASGFDSRIPDFGSVRTLHCTFKTTMVEVKHNLSLEDSDSKWPLC